EAPQLAAVEPHPVAIGAAFDAAVGGQPWIVKVEHPRAATRALESCGRRPSTSLRTGGCGGLLPLRWRSGRAFVALQVFRTVFRRELNLITRAKRFTGGGDRTLQRGDVDPVDLLRRRAGDRIELPAIAPDAAARRTLVEQDTIASGRRGLHLTHRRRTLRA